MNAAAVKPQTGWYPAKSKDVTVAVISSEENIAHAGESFHQSPEPSPKLMKMEVFANKRTQEAKPNKWLETAKFAGKVGLMLGAGALGATVAALVGAGVAGAGAALGLAGGVLAGATVLTVGAAKKNVPLASAGALMLTGALNTTGLPVAEAALGMTMLGTMFAGYISGIDVSGIDGPAAKANLKQAWSK